METADKKEIAGLVLGVAFGVVPWLLDKVNIEVPIFLANVLLYLSIPVVVWALAKLGWLGRLGIIRDKFVSVATVLLLCVGVLLEAGLWFHRPTTYTAIDWMKEFSTLQEVTRQSFLNEDVELDGKRFDNCTFTNVTFIYRGQKPFQLMNNHIIGPYLVKVVVGPQSGGAILTSDLFFDMCRGRETNCDTSQFTDAVEVDEKLNPMPLPGEMPR